MEREVMQLAAYKLCAEDRTLLKWILRGKSVSQMGRDLNLCQSATQQRVNGLLWTLRCRADLAAYLEVQPAEIIPRNTSRHAMAVSKFPPAKRAM